MSGRGQSAIVVGGGIAGLATAALLGREGYSVTLCEARNDLGGRAGTWEQNGFRFDTGPSWYLMPEVFEHFFRLLGTSADEQLDLAPLTPAYRVYSEPAESGSTRSVDVISGRAEAIELFEQIEPGAGERIDAYLDSAGDAYDLAISRFLYDTYETKTGLLDPALLRRLPQLLPLLTRNLASHIDRQFTDPQLQKILAYPAVFLGGSPYGVPSLYHLMSHLDLDDGVRYPRGGFVTVIDAIAGLARAQGVHLRTNAPVARISTRGGHAQGVTLESGEELSADIVVSTADLHHTETTLLQENERTYPQKWWDKRVPSPGALLILLGVSGSLPELPHHTLLFADDWRSNFDAIFGAETHIPDPASIYVCRPSATDDNVAPQDHENLFVLVPIPADPTLGYGGIDGDGDATIEKAADAVISQISQWCGVPDLADRIVVRRTIGPGDFVTDLNSWRGNSLGLAHTLGQSAFFRPGNVSKKVDGLYYAGTSALPGIGLPMCLISAELVIKRLRGDKTAGPLAEPAGAGA